MIGLQLVAIKAGIVCPAAVELYGDDIELAAIVGASAARIYLDASDRNSHNPELHVRLPRKSHPADLVILSSTRTLNVIHARMHRSWWLCSSADPSFEFRD